MHYRELEELQKSWNGKVCLFGAGLIGKTWAYDILKEIGFQIDFYCDNNKEENLNVRDNIKTISLNSLFFYKNEVLVFITVTKKYQHSISRQLENNGIYNIISVDYSFLQSFIESLIAMDDKQIKERFKCVFDDKEYISRQFECRMGYKLDLNNPQTFNEKLQWLKLYDRKPEYTQMVDKYEVKNYVADQIGDEYIIPTFGVYNFFDEIEFEKLPKQFVLKCTHDSGSTILVDNKETFDYENAKRKLQYALGNNLYWIGREWTYKDVPPRIIVEKYMCSPDSIIDYKFMCFQGEPKVIFTCTGRCEKDGLKVTFFDTDWNKLNFERHYPSSCKEIKRPQNLKLMIQISKKLSEGFSFVRVDFYEIKGRVYFGELTFFPGNGMEEFEPVEWDYILGEWIKV